MIGKKSAVTVAAVVTVVVLGSTASTGAWWNDAEQLDGGTLRSGELSLVNGSTTEQSSSYDFTELAATNLSPGRYAQAPLTVHNDGTADARYRLAGVELGGDPDLGAQLDLTATVVTAAGDCPTGVDGGDPTNPIEQIYSGPLPADGLETQRSLPVETAEIICLRVQLDPDAPSTGQSGSGSITFLFAAEST